MTATHTVTTKRQLLDLTQCPLLAGEIRVLIELLGSRDVGVSQDQLSIPRRDAGVLEQRRRGVAQMVQRDPRQPMLATDAQEGAEKVAGLYGASRGALEDESFVCHAAVFLSAYNKVVGYSFEWQATPVHRCFPSSECDKVPPPRSELYTFNKVGQHATLSFTFRSNDIPHLTADGHEEVASLIASRMGL